MASGVRLYMAGTIAVENGDDSGPNGGSIVTGTLTLWIGNALAGSPVRMPDGQIYFVIVDAEENTEMEIYPPYEGTTVASGGTYILSRYTDRLAASALQTVRTKELHDKLQTFFGGEGDPDPLLGGVGSVYIQRSGNELDGARVKDESGWGPLLTNELSPELEAFGDLIESYKDDAEAAATAAAASATAAAGSATTAAGHVATASGHASAAGTSAAAADTSADAALVSQTAAAASATAAATSQTAAATSATNAATGATNAATSATTATTQAGTATTQATAAAASASAAASSATAAASSATAADTSADAADASADAAAASAALAAVVSKFTTTSATSRTIGTGPHTFTLDDADVQYIGGERIRIASDASAANFMLATVTSKSSATLVVEVDDVGGSGSHADWNISLTGERGTPGSGTADSVNGVLATDGDVTLTASDIAVPATATNIEPAGDSVNDWLVALDEGLAGTAFQAVATVASSSTLNLTAYAGLAIDVSGTTTINAVTLPDGARCLVRFTGALTLTNGASLVLPGAANIATAAGDYAEFIGYSGGVVRVRYHRASGAPVTPSGWQLITTAAASSSASIVFTAGLNSTYDQYMIQFDGVVPATDQTYLRMRVNIGSGYATASYTWGGQQLGPSGGAATGSTTDSITDCIPMLRPSPTLNLGNDAGEYFNGIVEFANPDTAAQKFSCYTRTHHTRADGIVSANSLGGQYNVQGALTGIQFTMSSGNIASGNFRLYGLKK